MTRAPFGRVRGGIELRLAPGETDVLRPLFGQMLELLAADTSTDDMRRLFPPAYQNDAEAQAEYDELMRDELLEGKKSALRRVDGTFEKARLKRGLLTVRLDEDEQQAWLSSLNDLRLYLGTRLGVTEETYEMVDPESADPAFQVYLYLGWLEETLLEALVG